MCVICAFVITCLNLPPGYNELVTVIVNLLFSAYDCDLDYKQKYSVIPSSSFVRNKVDSNSSKILHLGACPKQEEEQEFVMTAVEALRSQLDNLQKEKQELKVRLLKCTQTQPDAVAVVEIEQDRDHWKEKVEGVVSENSQLRALYEELLKYKSQWW